MDRHGLLNPTLSLRRAGRAATSCAGEAVPHCPTGRRGAGSPCCGGVTRKELLRAQRTGEVTTGSKSEESAQPCRSLERTTLPGFRAHSLAGVYSAQPCRGLERTAWPGFAGADVRATGAITGSPVSALPPQPRCAQPSDPASSVDRAASQARSAFLRHPHPLLPTWIRRRASPRRCPQHPAQQSHAPQQHQ